MDADVVALVAFRQTLAAFGQIDGTAVADGFLELLGTHLLDEIAHAADPAVVPVAEFLERLGDRATELDGMFGLDEDIEFRAHAGTIREAATDAGVEAVVVLAADLFLCRDEPEIVDLGLGTIVFAARDRDLELPGQVGVLAVLGEVVRDGVDDRLGVETLVVVEPGCGAAKHVPCGVTTALNRRQADLVVALPHLGDVLDADPVFLDVLSGGDVEVGVAPQFVLFLASVLLGGDGEVIRDLTDDLSLVGGEIATRDLGPDHEVVVLLLGVHARPLQTLPLAATGAFLDFLVSEFALRVVVDILNNVKGMFFLFVLFDCIHANHREVIGASESQTLPSTTIV